MVGKVQGPGAPPPTNGPETAKPAESPRDVAKALPTGSFNALKSGASMTTGTAAGAPKPNAAQRNRLADFQAKLPDDLTSLQAELAGKIASRKAEK